MLFYNDPFVPFCEENGNDFLTLHDCAANRCYCMYLCPSINYEAFYITCLNGYLVNFTLFGFVEHNLLIIHCSF